MPNPEFSLHTHLSDAEFCDLLKAAGRYKERSDQTYEHVHTPLLMQRPLVPIEMLLLGDSMLERLQTTGTHTQLGKSTFPEVFNAGVGGDQIRHVLFRLGSKGLFHALQERGVRRAIVSMGTNNLGPKRCLTSQALQEYALVLEALHRASQGLKILVVGIMPRQDVREEFVDRSNDDLQGLVKWFNGMVGDQIVYYLPPHPDIGLDALVDHVHLNEDGYTLFAQAMWDKQKDMAGESYANSDT